MNSFIQLSNNNINILLFGGEGFLGKGLQKVFLEKEIPFKSIDIKDYDLSKADNVHYCINDLKNVSHIVILASKIGAKLFNTDAKNSSAYNRMIFDVLKQAIIYASRLYNTSFDVTYYSTSEIFGSLDNIDTVIDDKSLYKFNMNTDRYLYSYVKWQAEEDLKRLYGDKIISNLKIIRPFNIYGRNLQRGVVYDMIYSALTKNEIYYSKDTTRTLTDIDLASSLAAEAILSKTNILLNAADCRNSLYMKTLAKIINDVLGMHCKLIELPVDSVIQYRHISKVDNDIFLSKNIMAPYIIELADLIRAKI